MEPLAKIETMRAMSLHPGIESQSPAVEISGLILQPVEQHLSRTSRTPNLIAHQIIHIEPAPFIGILNDSPHTYGNDLAIFYHNGHAGTVGKHLAQTRGVIHR